MGTRLTDPWLLGARDNQGVNGTASVTDLAVTRDRLPHRSQRTNCAQTVTVIGVVNGLEVLGCCCRDCLLLGVITMVTIVRRSRRQPLVRTALIVVMG